MNPDIPVPGHKHGGGGRVSAGSPLRWLGWKAHFPGEEGAKWGGGGLPREWLGEHRHR